MYKKSLPNVERLRYLLMYDPDTGGLHWRNPTHHLCTKGVICPGNGARGYKVVTVDKVTYLQHRVIWAMQTGFPPPDDAAVDHVDGDPGNNRWWNLRLLTRAPEARPAKTVDRRRNKTPIVRAHKAKSKAGWEARVYINGCRVHLGTFPTEEQALAAKIPEKIWPRETKL